MLTRDWQWQEKLGLMSSVSVSWWIALTYFHRSGWFVPRGRMRSVFMEIPVANLTKLLWLLFRDRCLLIKHAFNLFQLSPQWTWVNSGGQAHRTARSLSAFPLSSRSNSVLHPTHSLWDLFFNASNLLSATLVQKASSFSASSNSGLDKLAAVRSRPVVSLSVMPNLCTSY